MTYVPPEPEPGDLTDEDLARAVADEAARIRRTGMRATWRSPRLRRLLIELDRRDHAHA